MSAGLRFDLATAAEIRFGSGRVAELPAALRALGAGSVCVVAGGSADRDGPLRAELAAAGLGVHRVAVAGEPTVESLRAAVRACRDAASDAVVGFGGGSVLDTAKAVAALVASGTDPMEHLEVVGEGRPLGATPLPMAAVPTTAGTGSEVTRNAVLAAGPVKVSLRSVRMLPRLALVDPDLLVGLPPAVIASSGGDALSQLIEPFLSLRATPVTDALARDGILRSARSLRRAFQGGMDDDPVVRDDLAVASLFGGLCLANSGLGAVHGIAAAAGARFGAPHGAVCAAVLPGAVAVTLAALRERAPDHPALARMREVAGLLTGLPEAGPDDAIDWLQQLRDDLQLPGLGAYGVGTEQLDDLVADAQRASSMGGHPIPLRDDEVAHILDRAR